MDKFTGITAATSDKRYKNFINTVADREYVWLLDNGDGYMCHDELETIYLLVWQEQKFAENYAESGEHAVAIEVHEFCERCKENLDNKDLKFMVCPNNVDSFVVTVDRMLDDLLEALSKLE